MHCTFGCFKIWKRIKSLTLLLLLTSTYTNLPDTSSFIQPYTNPLSGHSKIISVSPRKLPYGMQGWPITCMWGCGWEWATLFHPYLFVLELKGSSGSHPHGSRRRLLNLVGSFIRCIVCLNDLAALVAASIERWNYSSKHICTSYTRLTRHCLK